MVDSWFDKEHLLQYQFPQQDKSIMKIIEEALVFNRYVLQVIERSCKTAIEFSEDNKNRLDEQLNSYNFLIPSYAFNEQFVKEEEVMLINSIRDASEIWAELRWQLYTCLNCLEILKKGEGMLYKVNVDSFGDLDLYQCLYLIALQMKEKIAAIMTLEKEYEKL